MTAKSPDWLNQRGLMAWGLEEESNADEDHEVSVREGGAWSIRRSLWSSSRGHMWLKNSGFQQS